MNKIFIFTAGNQDAREHLNQSIINPIVEDIVYDAFAAEERDVLKKISSDYGGFYAWGAVPGSQNIARWGAIAKNDYALCVYDNTYHYLARIVAKYDNQKLARQVWGEDDNGNTWQYMYFLTKPVKVNTHVDQLATYLNAGYMGFTKISDDKINKIEQDYQSVDNFLNLLIHEKLELQSFWWVCQGASYTEDKGQKFLWAPHKDKSGASLYHWDNIRKVKKDDIIFNYANGAVQGVSIAKDRGYDYQNDNAQWEKEGTRVDIDHYKIDGIEISTIKEKIESLREALGSVVGPFDINGAVKQGYLFEINYAVVIILKAIYGKRFPDAIEKLFPSSPMKGQPMQTSKILTSIHEYILSKGFSYSLSQIVNIYLSLKSKPFVILAGISGTGKTQLVRQFASAINASCELIPVRPDWTDNSDIIGYKNLNDEFQEKRLLQVIAAAMQNPDQNYFVLLDEMNLARVEHYFSDFLSIFETREVQNKRVITNNILHVVEVGGKKGLADLYIPDNLYIVGTVNMDETTHPFSRKVLDRANSIELNEIDLQWNKSHSKNIMSLQTISNSFLQARYVHSSDMTEEEKNSLKDVILKLIELNDILKKADLHFGYRVRDEICFYMLYRKEVEDVLSFEKALDYQIMQKILPRIQGSSQRVKSVIVDLIKTLSENNTISDTYNLAEIENEVKDVSQYKYGQSLHKLLFMLRRFQDDGFTSFWL